MKKISLFLLVISMSYCSNSGPAITNDTLAVVNNRTITKQEFVNQAQSLINTPSVNISTNDGRINMLKDMINEELIFQQALKEQFHLKNLEIKHEVVREYLKQKFGKDIPVISDDEVKNFYNSNQSELDQVRASHILFSFKQGDTKEKKEAYALAQKVHADLLAKKITFKEAATKYSKDSASQQAEGDLSYFARNRMVAPFANAAFALKKVGEISPIVESQYGYHIIELTGEMRGYDVYKEKIRWKLAQSAMQPKINTFFNNLKENANTKITSSDLLSIDIAQP